MTIDDGSRLVSEGPSRALRRCRLSRSATYSRMYRDLGARILEGQPLGSRESIERSAGLVLDLEASLQR